MTARAVSDLKPIHLQVLSKIVLAEELCVDIELMTQVGRESRGDHVRGSVTVPSATIESQQKEHHCMHYAATFASQHALHTHVAKMHREMVPRFVPSEFRRELHAKDGMPTCTACHMEFKLWKGLRNHLLSGTCPEPSTLRDITQSADQQSHNHEMQKPQHLKKQVQGSPRSALGTVACIQTHGFCSTDVFLWLLDAGSHKGEIPYTPGTSQGLAIRRSPGPTHLRRPIGADDKGTQVSTLCQPVHVRCSVPDLPVLAPSSQRDSK